MNKQSIKGILLVAIGASSYGVVAIFVKKGLADGFNVGELVFAQAFVGMIVIILLNLFSRAAAKSKEGYIIPKKDKIKLLLGGIPLACTSTFYYISLQYVPVSVCIVMLMQSVWISVVIDYFVNKVKPTAIKLIAIVVILCGTILATNVLKNEAPLDWRGFAWGLLAAFSYSFTFLVTNNVAPGYKPLARSMYMVLGLVTTVLIIWGSSLSTKFDPTVIWKWGAVTAFFGTILPPLLFTKGMPLVGVGLGGIVASIELPVSVTIAYFAINEPVNLTQWLGIALILLSVVLMNISFDKKKHTTS